jgi:ABC-2 type transport system permease protein/oleandomycin transport system permease protein
MSITLAHRSSVVRDALVLTKRNVLRLIRTPQLAVFSTIQPVMFVLLFVYVFGGALKPALRGQGFPYSYPSYLIPGILVQTALFGGGGTAVGLAEDFSKGIIDRFRSLPMARSAVLMGRTLGDLVRNVFVIVLMLVVGTLVGFRFHNGFAPGLLALVLALAFGFAFSWIFAIVGMLVREPETAQVASILPTFPLVFASSSFTPTSTMPSWLRAFANHQPVSVTVNAIRNLTQGGPVGSLAWQSVAWIIGILVVFVPLAVRIYRKG